MKQLLNMWSIFISIFSYLLGGLDSLITTLLIVIMIDYTTGILKAIYQRDLNSKVGLKGIIKKCGYIFIVILATLADRLLGDGESAIRTIVIYSFIANESLSILENWGSMGLPLPKKLVEVFSSLKDSNR